MCHTLLFYFAFVFLFCLHVCVGIFQIWSLSRKSNSEGTALSRLRNTLEITAVEAMTVYFAVEKYWFALCLFLLWHKAQHDEMHISYFYE